MADGPTLSVFMSNYNHSMYLVEAVRSVLDQSYPAAEVIIIDDASTDDSYETLEGLAREDPRVRLYRNERNRGVTANMGRLLAMASGDYVFGAACDDKVLPGFFEKCMGLLARHPGAGLCSALTRRFDRDGNDLGVMRSPVASSRPAYIPPARARRLVGRYGTWHAGNAVIYRRDAILNEGGFPPELHAFCDGFICLVLSLKYGACFVPEPLASWRVMATGYAASTTANAVVKRQLVENATRLMRVTYRDLFPPRYAEDWQADMVFEWGRSVLASQRRQYDDFLDRSGTLPPGPGLSGRLLTAADRLASRLRDAASVACLFARTAPRHFIRRRLHSLTHRRFYSVPGPEAARQGLPKASVP